MKDEIKNVIIECERLNLENKMTFPMVVQKLSEAGVERYCVDLVRFERADYWDNEFYRTELLLRIPKGVAAVFSEEMVKEALRVRQEDSIDYVTFLERIMKAGVVCYTVYLKGRQVHYVGRKGDIWIQRF